MKKQLYIYLKLFRVKHYIKNILVFLPIIFNKSFFKYDKLSNAFLAFIAFCLVSSAVYIINDIQDAEKDKNHPVKKNRPIASGAIPIRSAVVIAGMLIVLSVLVNLCIQTFWGCVLVISYLIINVLYSLGLKDQPLIDVVILTSGFIIRVVYGGIVTQIEISRWLYLTIFSGAFYMGLGKRRNEIQKQGSAGTTRTVLEYYNYDFLDKNMYVCVALTDTFYALWALEKQINHIVWTVPIFIILLMRYSLDIEGNSDGDPVDVILHDKILIGIGLFYIGCMFIFLYMV